VRLKKLNPVIWYLLKKFIGAVSVWLAARVIKISACILKTLDLPEIENAMEHGAKVIALGVTAGPSPVG